MNIRLRISALLSLIGAFSAYAQTSTAEISADKGLTAEKCFKDAPGGVLGLLNPNTRLDMIDYFKAGIDRQSDNNAGGKCRILDLQDYSITFVGGTGIEYQMFVLDPKGENPVIGLIQTLDTPIPDSYLMLYRTDWENMRNTAPNALDGEPEFDKWILPSHKKMIGDIAKSVPFVMAKYVYDPDSGTLTATANMHSYFAPSDTPEALSMLKDKIVYRWNPKSKAFLPMK